MDTLLNKLEVGQLVWNPSIGWARVEHNGAGISGTRIGVVTVPEMVYFEFRQDGKFNEADKYRSLFTKQEAYALGISTPYEA